MDTFLLIFDNLITSGFDSYPAVFISCIILVLFWIYSFNLMYVIISSILKLKYYVFWYEDNTFSVENSFNYKLIRKYCEKKYNAKLVRVDEYKDKNLLYVDLINSNAGCHNANQVKSIFIDLEKKDFLERKNEK